MFISAIGTAVPSRRYTQRECLEYAERSKHIRVLTPSARLLVQKVLGGDNGIEARHLCLESLDEAFQLDPDDLHKRFATHAPELATTSAERALCQCGTSASEIGALVVSTCTGYLCPGLTSYISERLGLSDSALLLDLVGQGCGAAVPNLRACDALLASGRVGKVLSICVEVCSAAFYIDNDPGVLISACLFGDGAAAAVLSSEPPPGTRRIEWRDAGTLISPSARQLLRFEQRDGKLRNILSKKVSDIAGTYVRQVFDANFAAHGLSKNQITAWILHAGGKNVLAAVRDKLELSGSDLQWSASVLKKYGNLSSPFVLFVLYEALNNGAPGGLWWLSSFGAGFSCHGALLKVD